MNIIEDQDAFYCAECKNISDISEFSPVYNSGKRRLICRGCEKSDSSREFRCIDCDAIHVIDVISQNESAKMFIFFNRANGYNCTLCRKCRHNYKFVQHIYAITSPDFLQLCDNCENIAFIHEVSYCGRCGLTACSRCPMQFDEQTRGNIAMKICSCADDCEQRRNKCENTCEDYSDDYFGDNSDDYTRDDPTISR